MVNGGQGANLIMGGPGQDFIVAGPDGVSEVFAGLGDDFILWQPDERGVVTVTDNVGDDGTDTLHNIDVIKFADLQVINNTQAIGSPAISDNSPTEGQMLTASPGTIQDPNGTTTSVFSYQWQVLIGST